jgi:hypothetical protein
LEGLAKEYSGIFYGHFVYFTAKWYILWPFGTICGRSGYVSHFGMLYLEKSGNPDSLYKVDEFLEDENT